MVITLGLIVILLVLIYLLRMSYFDYWTKRGVVSVNSCASLTSFFRILKQKWDISHYLDNIYHKYKDKEDFVGIYNMCTPKLLILNYELCKQIYEKDFKHFHDNEFSTYIGRNTDNCWYNPFLCTGDQWEVARKLFVAGLDTETIKTAFYSTRESTRKFRSSIESHIKELPQNGLQIKDLCLHYTSEIVTNFVFGFRFCGLPTTHMVFNVIVNNFRNNAYSTLYFFLIHFIPKLRPFFKMYFMSERITNLFEKLMKTAVDLRRSQVVLKDHRDYLNYLLRLQKEKNLTTMEMTSFSMPFAMHGLTTTFTILANCLLLLAKHPKVQRRLQNEILQYINEDGIVDFENLLQMQYLDAFVYETLRVLSPAYYASKICTEPILIKNKSGRSVKLEKGDIVILPLHSFMCDEDFYENPKELQPERFLDANGACNVNEYHEKGIYYGFGAGPRKCAGEQFAVTQIKAALIDIFQHFYVRLNPKTCENCVIGWSYFNDNKSNVWLDFETRN